MFFADEFHQVLVVFILLLLCLVNLMNQPIEDYDFGSSLFRTIAEKQYKRQLMKKNNNISKTQRCSFIFM